ncbi:MAG: Uroporphyrinogen decarboxylase [Anaerolineales bacterium]|nr:Uroporphyrinogen decarboxylase [Anaerolineales bacterium]
MPVIEIDVTIEELAARKERIEKAQRFEEPDRVPVLPAINYRFLLPQIDVSFRDYYNDPETMLRSQILAQKWLMENIKTDQHAITGAWVGGWTDFQNASEPSAMGCEVVFPEDDIVWVNSHWVKNDKDLRKLEKMDVIRNGLHGRAIRFRAEMMKVAEKCPVRFLGGPIFYPGENPVFTHTSDGPFTNAGDLMGQTELFVALYERPDSVKALLQIITDKTIEYLDFCWEELELPHRDFAFTDDLAAALSPELYEEFVLPYDVQLRDHFQGRVSLHMCGKTDHLLHYFVDDLRIHEFQGFGWEVDKRRLASVMGGKVVLLGNISPLTILNGTPAQVKEETRRAIEVFGPCKGYIIQDGNNIAPGSPIENINAMYESAVEYGRYSPFTAFDKKPVL